MDPKIYKWLFDALEASKNICGFLEEKTFENYRSDLLLKSSVERQFEIIGEALRWVRDEDEKLIEGIEGWRGVISFRNILAHSYNSIEDEIVWGIIERDLPVLIERLEKLM